MNTLPHDPFAGHSHDWREGYEYGIDTFAAELKARDSTGASSWKSAYEDAHRQFQQETLRTSEYFQLTERIVAKLIGIGHRDFNSPPCSNCDICRWLIDAKELMARPINVSKGSVSGPPRPSSPPTHRPIG